MTRAEAEAAVIAAAREMLTRYERSPGSFWKEAPGLRDAFAALDALPPDDTDVEIEMRMTEPQMAQLVETFSRWVQAVTPLALVAKLDTIAVLGVSVPRALHEARALAWEAGEWLHKEREWVAMYHNVYAWNLACLVRDGDWPTRDAEHSQHAGTYRPTATSYTVQAGHEGYVPTASAAPAPSGSEGMAGGAYGGPPWRVQLDRIGSEVAGIAVRLGRLETAVMGHECAGPRELIDGDRLDALAAQVRSLTERLHMHETEYARARLDTLAAQVGRIERAVRVMLRLLGSDGAMDDDAVLGILDGGCDGAAE